MIVQHVLLMHARGLQGTNIIQKGLREILLKSLQLPSAFRINAWKVILLLNARTWVAKTLTAQILVIICVAQRDIMCQYVTMN